MNNHPKQKPLQLSLGQTGHGHEAPLDQGAGEQLQVGSQEKGWTVLQ